MSLSPTLQKLDRLNKSSPDFHGQLSALLYGREYHQCAPNLQGDDLVWLIDYLDNVRCYIALPSLRLTLCRLSGVSIQRVAVSGNVYVNSKAYAALGRCSQHRTRFHLIF